MSECSWTQRSLPTVEKCLSHNHFSFLIHQLIPAKNYIPHKDPLYLSPSLSIPFFISLALLIYTLDTVTPGLGTWKQQMPKL